MRLRVLLILSIYDERQTTPLVYRQSGILSQCNNRWPKEHSNLEVDQVSWVKAWNVMPQVEGWRFGPSQVTLLSGWRCCLPETYHLGFHL